MAQDDKPFHAYLKPDINDSNSNMNIESSPSSINLALVDIDQTDSKSPPVSNDEFGSADFLLHSAQSAGNYPKITKPPTPPPIKQHSKKSSQASSSSQTESDEKKAEILKHTKKSGLSSSAMNLFTSAKSTLSRGAKTVSSKTAERMSLEGQLKQARISLEKFLHPKIINMDKTIPNWVLKGAKGIVFLTVVKAGFLFAGSVGTGCVLVKRSNGSWSGPSSIGVAGIAAGFLVGASKIDYIMILPNDNAVKQFTGKGQLRLGGEIQLAVGPLGRDASGSVGTGDKGFSVVYSYSHAAGLYGGLGLDGKVISVRPKCNEEFYGEKLSVSDILVGNLDASNIQNNDYDLVIKLLDAYCIDDDDHKSNDILDGNMKQTAVFGRDLNDLECTKLKQYTSEIPNVLVLLKDTLYKYEGHLVKGIFRTAPPQKELIAVKSIIDDGKMYDIDFEAIDASIIAELIKMWYRERPIKILYELDAHQIESVETVSDAQDLMDKLKEAELSHFYWLLDLCIEVAKYNDINLMSANNMAIIIAPCLFDTDKEKSVSLSTSVVEFVSLCIELRMEMLHLDDANKIMDDVFDSSKSSLEPINVAKKPDSLL